MQGQLGFDGMPERLVRVTPARLATWADCRRRYRMTYLDHPTPPRGGAKAHSTMGACVHNALRAYFGLSAPRRTPERAAGLLVKYWKGDGFADEDQSRHYRDRAAGWVSDYVARLDPELEPVGLERWVAAPVGNLIAEGRVDRIDERGGELVIVDYKTGRHGLSCGDAASSQALALYALAARRTLRRPCTRVELHHLPTGAVAVAEHTEDTLARQLHRAEELAREFSIATEALAAGGAPDALFPPTLGRHCSWCEFRRSCQEGRAAAPEQPAWAMLAP
ncbi:MAG: RecB family exonuclease [Sciscionella sp.]